MKVQSEKARVTSFLYFFMSQLKYMNVSEKEFAFDGFEMWKVLNIFAISGKCWLRPG